NPTWRCTRRRSLTTRQHPQRRDCRPLVVVERRMCVERLIQAGALSLGGVLGVNARYWLGVWINRWAGSQFPWATFTINVTGSFLIGFLTMLLARWLPHPNMRI